MNWVEPAVKMGWRGHTGAQSRPKQDRRLPSRSREPVGLRGRPWMNRVTYLFEGCWRFQAGSWRNALLNIQFRVEVRESSGANL